MLDSEELDVSELLESSFELLDSSFEELDSSALSDELDPLALSEELESMVSPDELESSEYPDEFDLPDSFDELDFSVELGPLSLLDDEPGSMMLDDEDCFSSLGVMGWVSSVHATKATKVVNKTNVKNRVPMVINIKKDGHEGRLFAQRGLLTFRREPVPRGGSACGRACCRCWQWAFRCRSPQRGGGWSRCPAG